MKSSKKYQEIADTLYTVRLSLGITQLHKGDFRSDNPEAFLLEKIVDQFCYDFQKANPRFRPSFFRSMVWR